MVVAFEAAPDSAGAGMMVILTGLLYGLYILASFILLFKRRSEMGVGVVIGLGLIMVFISLMNAIYWGSLSQCSPGVSQYPCQHRGPDKAVCISSAIMAVLQVSYMFSCMPMHLSNFVYLFI